MMTSLRLSLLGALIFLAVTAHAQVTYTNTQTISAGTLALTSTGSTAVQTFTGFSSLSAVTWQVTNTGGSLQAATFNAYLVQWNSPSNTMVGSLQTFGSSVFSGNTASNATANLNFTASSGPLDPGLTYALLLSFSGGSPNFVANYTGAVATNPDSLFFGSGGRGSVAAGPSSPGGLQTNLQTLGGISPDVGQAYSMSITGSLAATPEPKTAAAAFAALFVVGLVGRRAWQRRQSAAPVAVTA